jgi:hypothetical protein
MVCDRCHVEKPVEDFELGRARPEYHSHEVQALDRLRREPEMVCRACYRPPSTLAALDRALATEVGERPPVTDGLLDHVAELLDRWRRRGR